MNTVATTQPITDELRRWIVAQAEAGCRPEDVLQAMVKSGWNEEVAVAAMETTLRDRLQALGLPLPTEALVTGAAGAAGAAVAAASPAAGPGPHTPVVGKPMPEPALVEVGYELSAGGRAVNVLAAMALPRVVVFGQLLADDECQSLIELARPRLTRSETVDNKTGGSEVNEARTSEGMFFERGETPLIARLEERIAALLNWPVENGEGLQILRYGPGAEYKPHHDYFDPVHPGSATILARGGQRVASLVMYLNTPERGGATVFPDVGFEVAPIRGNAVFFSYDRPTPTTRTLHGGAPVIAGVKWVATKWLREGRFI